MFLILKKFNILMDKTQKKKIGILLIATTIGAVLEAVSVSLIIPLITAIMDPNIIYKNKIIKRICEIFDLHSHRTFIILCVACLVLVFVFKNIFLMLLYYAQARFVSNNRFATQKKFFNIFLNKDYEYFLEASSGEILRILQSDIPRTYGLLMIIIGLASECVVSLALVITIFLADMGMTLFVGAILIIMMLFILKVVKPLLSKLGKEWQKHSALVNKWILQAINGIKEVKVSAKEEYFEESFSYSRFKESNAEKWNTVLGNVPRLLIEMVSICSMLLLIAYLIFKGQEIERLIPTFAAFAMAAVRLMPSANRIITALNSIAYYESGVDKLLQIMQTVKKSEVNKVIDEKVSFIKKIELKNIKYHYPNSKKYVLDGANMEIPAGSCVGIVGVSGAGKTTAVDALLGLLSIEKGEILVDGKKIYKNQRGWFSNIGYIPQTIFLLDGTIRENVAFGCKLDNVKNDNVISALKKARLYDFVMELPEGIDTQIGERGIRLSGGQRQRLGIARALYTDPKILIFDEATSALDNKTEAEIMEAINGLYGEKTMIIIAHRLQTIENCDIVYRVEDGKIAIQSQK